MNSSILVSAFHFAAQKHTGQLRKGAKKEPYINHPVQVAYLINTVGEEEDTAILAAAVLHDTLEDTDAEESEIEALFGRTVLEYVKEVTDDKSLPKSRRKELQIEHAPNLSPGATLIKIADKISNVSDITSSPPKNWDKKRKEEYLDWAEAVVNKCKNTNKPLIDHFQSVILKARKNS